MKKPSEVPLGELYINIPEKHVGVWLPYEAMDATDLMSVQEVITATEASGNPVKLEISDKVATIHMYWSIGKYINESTWNFGHGILDSVPYERDQTIAQFIEAESKSIIRAIMAAHRKNIEQRKGETHD